MEVLKSFDIDLKNNSVVTIGNFDGVHIGHQKLIENVKKYSEKENLTSIVFSFLPHPVHFFSKDKDFLTIFSEEEKILELEKYGIDLFIQCPFDSEFAALEPEEFVFQIINRLKCKILIIGSDYSFGKNRKGNYDFLKTFEDKHDIKIIKIDTVEIDGEKVSSTKIKELIFKKDIKKANKCLKKPFSVLGEVLQGNKLGRKIGFPTVNLAPVENKILLPDGVYITQTEYDSKIYNSITNIGKKPTIPNQERLIETFIFDFNQEIYTQKIKIMFLAHIRNEKKFDGIDQLKAQISKDVQVAKQFFDDFGKN